MGAAPSFSKALGLPDAADFLDEMPQITEINQPEFYYLLMEADLRVNCLVRQQSAKVNWYLLPV